MAKNNRLLIAKEWLEADPFSPVRVIAKDAPVSLRTVRKAISLWPELGRPGSSTGIFAVGCGTPADLDSAGIEYANGSVEQRTADLVELFFKDNEIASGYADTDWDGYSMEEVALYAKNWRWRWRRSIGVLRAGNGFTARICRQKNAGPDDPLFVWIYDRLADSTTVPLELWDTLMKEIARLPDEDQWVGEFHVGSLSVIPKNLPILQERVVEIRCSNLTDDSPFFPLEIWLSLCRDYQHWRSERSEIRW